MGEWLKRRNGVYRLYLPNEMMEHLAYLHITIDCTGIVHSFGRPETATPFTWLDANITQGYMEAYHGIRVEIKMVD